MNNQTQKTLMLMGIIQDLLEHCSKNIDVKTGNIRIGLQDNGYTYSAHFCLFGGDKIEDFERNFLKIMELSGIELSNNSSEEQFYNTKSWYRIEVLPYNFYRIYGFFLEEKEA